MAVVSVYVRVVIKMGVLVETYGKVASQLRVLPSSKYGAGIGEFPGILVENRSEKFFRLHTGCREESHPSVKLYPVSQATCAPVSSMTA